MNWCQEKRWKNGTLPSWNEMLRIPVPVTFNPGWGWTTLEGLILRRQSGVREPEASGTPGTSQPSITRPARLHITGVSGACDHSSASNARTRKEAGARNYHWPLCLLLPFCVRLAVVTLPDEASPIFLDAPTSNQWCLWVLCLYKVVSPLLCQLSSNLSLRFSRLDFYRLQPNVCWKSALCTQQGRAGSQCTWNEFFLINALFKMVHDALVESVHV